MAFREGVTCVGQDERKHAYLCTSGGCVKIFRHHQFPSDSLPTTQTLENSTPWLVVHPDVPPSFPVSKISVSFSGRCALLSGEVENKDSDGDDGGVVEFRFGVLVLANPKITTSEIGTRCVGRFFHYPAPTVGRGTPSVKAIKWCRASDTHLCMLTSNNHFLMYEVREDRAPRSYERDYHLLVSPGTSICGLLGNDTWVEDFELGPVTLWGVFSVFFLCSDGGIYMLCPIAPRGTLVPESIRHQLSDSLNLFDLSGGQFTEFIDGLHEIGGGALVVHGEKVAGGKDSDDREGHSYGIDLDMGGSDEEETNKECERNSCPALQGPLNDVSECFGFEDGHGANSPSISCTTDRNGLVVITTASGRGEVFFYVLLSEVLPLFSLARSNRGRYTCELMEPTDPLHMLNGCISRESGVSDTFCLAEVPDTEGCFLCWGQKSKAFQLDVPSLKMLPEGELSDADLIIQEIQPPVTPSSPTESPCQLLGLLWMSGGTLLVWGTLRGFKVTEFQGIGSDDDPHDELGSWIAGNTTNFQTPGETESSSRRDEAGFEEYGRVLEEGEADWTPSQLDALDPFLQAHLTTVDEAMKQVHVFREYVRTKADATQCLMEGCRDALRNLEEVWNIVDAWPNQGSCDEMRKLLPIDMQALKDMVEGLRGACELDWEKENEDKELMNELNQFKMLNMRCLLAELDASRIALLKVKEHMKNVKI